MSFYYNNSIVVLDKAELTQYLAGGSDDRIRVRMLLWSLAFATPTLLSWTPTPSLSLPENPSSRAPASWHGPAAFLPLRSCATPCPSHA